MKTESFTMTAADGAKIFVYRWLPEGQPKGVVQIAHGLAEHAGRYARLADALTASGYAVYASDHRGHGRTARGPEDLGFFAEEGGWQKCVDDLRQLNRHMASAHPRLPVVLLGHSMGATLAEDFMGQHGEELAGVVLSGANGKPMPMALAGRALTRAERARLGPRGRSKLAQSLTFGAFNKRFVPARTPFDWLSRDQAEVDRYIADPLCGFSATIQLWVDLLDAWTRISGKAHRERVPRSLPIYVIAGGHDPVSAGTRQLEAWLRDYRAAGFAQVEHRFYSEGRHEVFNELNRDEVTAGLIAWLDKLRGPQAGTLPR